MSAVQTQILAGIYLTGWVDGRMDGRLGEHMDAQSPFAVLTEVRHEALPATPAAVSGLSFFSPAKARRQMWLPEEINFLLFKQELAPFRKRNI